MRTWSSCSESVFEAPFDFCLVNVLQAGGRAALPALSGAYPNVRGALIVICADEGSWKQLHAACEQASRTTGDTLPPTLLVLAGDDGLGAALDAVLDRVRTESVLFTAGGARLDLLAIGRVATQHAACGHAPLHVALNRTSAAGLRCRYGDYLRFRTSIDGTGVAVPALPRRPEELMLSRRDARMLGRRLCAVAPSSAWRRLLALGTFLAAPETASSPVIVGDLDLDHGDNPNDAGGDARPAPIGPPPEVRNLLQTLAQSTDSTSTGERGELFQALLALDVGAIPVRMASPVDDDELGAPFSLAPATTRAVEDEAGAIRLASLVLDHFDFGGLDSLESERETFEQQLLRDFADAVLSGAIGRGGDALVPVLSYLCGRVCDRDWSLSAADLGWCAHALLDAAMGVGSGAANAPQAAARLRQVLGERLANDRIAPARLETLECELRQAHAILAELHPGRLATLIITTLRGSWRDWASFPPRLFALAWHAIIMERLRGRVAR